MANIVARKGAAGVGFSWAGYQFHELARHDAARVKPAGLYGFVARWREERVLLFAGETDCIARAVDGSHPHWADATAMGMNELHVFLQPRDRLERLLVLDRVVRRCEPLLNLLEAAPSPTDRLGATLSAWRAYPQSSDPSPWSQACSSPPAPRRRLPCKAP